MKYVVETFDNSDLLELGEFETREEAEQFIKLLEKFSKEDQHFEIVEKM